MQKIGVPCGQGYLPEERGKVPRQNFQQLVLTRIIFGENGSVDGQSAKDWCSLRVRLFT